MKNSDLTITTPASDLRDDLIAAALTARVHTTIVGASTLRVDLPDELRTATLPEALHANAEGRDWTLVAIRREAGVIRLVYEDARINALRQHTDRVMYQVALAAEDVIGRFGVEAGVPVTVDANIGQVHIEGAGRSLLDITTSWQEISSLAARLGGRAFATTDSIIVTSDAALLAGPAVSVSDRSGSVLSDITFNLDTAQPHDRATFTVSTEWTHDAGSIVDIRGTGPGDGLWIVADWTRDLPLVGPGRVRLTRPKTLGA